LTNLYRKVAKLSIFYYEKNSSKNKKKENTAAVLVVPETQSIGEP
jgi:hypothetical protein